MADVQNRNARCHCGSGKKFKNCHGAEAVRKRGIPMAWWVVGIVGLAVAVFVMLRQTGTTTPPGTPPPGKVWSEEHGHWHDAP